MYKEAQATMLQKTQMMSSGMKPHGSLAGSRLMDRKSSAFLAAERTENRLKKPTTFLCRLKFRNELPDPTAQPKLLAMNTNKDRFSKYTITSLEKMHKPKLYLEPDLGIPLDLLDISIYNPPDKRPPLAPEDEELLRDSEVATPVKQDGGIRIKERPTDKGVAWLVKTQYISPISMESAKLSITEKQAKELREQREGRNLFLENLNNREKQMQAIEESFKASKLHPVHQSNPNLEPVEIWPLLPDFERYEDRFLMVALDGDATAESEMYNKLDRSIRDDIESQAILKSYVVRGTDQEKSEKFLAYMVPKPDEILKDIYDESEEVDYTWIREYHWDVREGDAHDPATYLVNFDENVARYLPLPTKLVLQKRRAKEGKASDEVELFPPPSRVTVRKRSILSIEEAGPSQGIHASHGHGTSKLKRQRLSTEDDQEDDHEEEEPRHMEDVDQYSGEEEMSD